MPKGTLKINFGQAAVSFPYAAIEKIEKATKKDIKILVCLCSLGRMASDLETAVKAVVSELGCTEADVSNAVAFWRGAGVIDVCDTEMTVEAPKQADKVPPKQADKAPSVQDDTKLRHADELPKYTTEELTSILDRRKELSTLIDTCQQLYGKVFNTSEINILIGLSDYLGFDYEYILLLFAHVGKMERKSVRTVEKLAFRFADEEITDADMLREHLNFLERAEELETKVRATFGINSRALTSKERKLVQKWLGEYKFGFEIIEKAYELTIESTQKPSLPYAGAILDRWHHEGLDSLEKIEANIAERDREKVQTGSSFNEDEFLRAAMKRGYGTGEA